MECWCNIKRKALLRTIEHQQDGFKGKWDKNMSRTISLDPAKNHKQHRELLEEVLGFIEAKYNKKKVLNRDEGNLVKSNTICQYK